MPDWLTNPKAIIILLCLGALVLAINAPLLSLLLGKKAAKPSAPLWRQALHSGSERHRQQDAQLDELHRIVSEFKSKGASQDKSDD